MMWMKQRSDRKGKKRTHKNHHTVEVYACPPILLDERGERTYTKTHIVSSTPMLTQVTSFANIGLSSEKIAVEVGCVPGEGIMTIVGLGDTAVQESKQRVKMALRTSGFRLPTGKSITVNLAPADVKKIGPRYDLPIALGLLLALEALPINQTMLRWTGFIGELALDGTLRHVAGVLLATIAAKEHGMKRIVVPFENGAEAALVEGIDVIAVHSLSELIDVLLEKKAPQKVLQNSEEKITNMPMDFAEIRGQEQAKRAMEIAAAGGHNILLSGAPGSGKTLLARALRGILPPLSRDEALEVTQIYSVANLLPSAGPLMRERPFRIVHHTASGVSIVGGGQIPGPGEITLAHKGVLFLDELAEFPHVVLEVLRQPLEDRTITITRAQGSVTFPADFLLVAAINPPIENKNGSERAKRRISPPLLDRIDLTIDVQPVALSELRLKAKVAESSALILERVRRARERQQRRFIHDNIRTNKEMDIRHLRTHCMLSDESEILLRSAAEKLHLSARSYHRTLKVARTIADLAGSDHIAMGHVAEALQYRQSVGMNV